MQTIRDWFDSHPTEYAKVSPSFMLLLREGHVYIDYSMVPGAQDAKVQGKGSYGGGAEAN